MQTTQNTAKQN